MVSGAVEIDVPSLAGCLQATDAEMFAIWDRLATMPCGSARKEAELIHGWGPVEEALLSDNVARSMLPPSRAVNDAFHAYFCSSGIAQVEVVSAVTLLDSHGWPLSRMVQQMEQDSWQRPDAEFPEFNGGRCLFRAANFEGDQFRGSGRQCWQIIPWLFYYLCFAFKDRTEEKIRAAVESFRWLNACATELKRLRGFWRPLTEERFLQRLEACQSHHQIAYAKCYGLPKMKPKHHHRIHLGQHSIKLQTLPLVEVHERKHQILKSQGLVDRYEGFIGMPRVLQQALLPRMLETMVGDDSNTAMQDCNGVG